MRMVYIPTVRIDPEIDKAIRATAARQGETVSAVVRSALSHYLDHPATKVGKPEATPARRAKALS